MGVPVPVRPATPMKQAARDTGLLLQCPCGRIQEPGARFCDNCGSPLAYTGKTERLSDLTPIDD
jgi:uncharacterized OB-fold protein